jgi:hypothetical protein
MNGGNLPSLFSSRSLKKLLHALPFFNRIV